MNDLNDKRVLALVEGCKKNDRASQKMLYEHFYAFAMRICQRYSSGPDEAIEIMNDGFMKVFTKISKFDANLSLVGWIRRIMVNTAIDYYRKNKKYRLNSNLDDVDETKLLIEPAGVPVLSRIAYEDLIKLVQKLSPAYRAVFNMYVVDGYNHKEIAEKLKITEGASKSNLSKARERMKRLLKIFYHEEYAKYTG